MSTWTATWLDSHPSFDSGFLWAHRTPSAWRYPSHCSDHYHGSPRPLFFWPFTYDLFALGAPACIKPLTRYLLWSFRYSNPSAMVRWWFKDNKLYLKNNWNDRSFWNITKFCSCGTNRGLSCEKFAWYCLKPLINFQIWIWVDLSIPDD